MPENDSAFAYAQVYGPAIREKSMFIGRSNFLLSLSPVLKRREFYKKQYNSHFLRYVTTEQYLFSFKLGSCNFNYYGLFVIVAVK